MRSQGSNSPHREIGDSHTHTHTHTHTGNNRETGREKTNQVFSFSLFCLVFPSRREKREEANLGSNQKEEELQSPSFPWPFTNPSSTQRISTGGERYLSLFSFFLSLLLSQGNRDDIRQTRHPIKRKEVFLAFIFPLFLTLYYVSFPSYLQSLPQGDRGQRGGISHKRPLTLSFVCLRPPLLC